MTSKPYVFVCSPYMGHTGTDQEVARNLALARELAKMVCLAGGIPIVPHLFMHAVADEREKVYTRDDGLEFSRDMIKFSKGAVISMDYAASEGMMSDLRHIDKLERPSLRIYTSKGWQGELNEFIKSLS